ncbi:hypothetical protein [Brytella acorum]|uniref:Uncharacterized protein n=1 Tax=Brytella acorum TaxID=2959299 RepID=A0AA35XZF7_9PROT|nr:hypothetical protein [Brytella acorum]MDF3626218.1 hypothetical protein [Brytella acorum]CAI9122348.1 hypothetical protein LMG32879_003209 [Brytella acorum]
MILSTFPAFSGRIHAPSFLDATDADLAFYRRISLALGVQPPSSLFRYLLPEGKHLMQLGDRENWVWARLMRHAHARYSDLPTSGSVAGNGVVLNSVPERIVYEALHPVTPADVALDLEPAIGSPQFFSDFGIRVAGQVRYLEIVGACGSDRVLRNAWEEHLLQQFDKRLSHYAAYDIKPEIWYLDQIIDPQRMRQRFHAIIADLRRVSS